MYVSIISRLPKRYRLFCCRSLLTHNLGQDKVKEYEAASNRPPPSAADSTTQASDAKSLSSETYRATRLESTPLEKGAHGVPQRAMPTGVDTTDSAAGARSER